MKALFGDTSFFVAYLIMQRQRMTEALTTDHHFEQAGFRILLT
jgi:predicted nucleic acid-binding protein